MPISNLLSALPPVAVAPRGSDGARPAASQVLEGRSLGQNPAGQTLVAVGRQLVSIDLPQRPPAGTTINLQVQPDGQMTLVPSEAGEPVPLPQATKAALQALLLGNAGKTLAGQVLSSNADGTTTVLIGKLAVALELPGPPQPGTVVRLAVNGQGSAIRMLPLQSINQPATLATAVAVAPQSQPLLKDLMLQPGQRVSAQVLGQLPGGETEIEILGQKLVVTLPQARPAGSSLSLMVEADGADIRLSLASVPAAGAAKPATPSPLQALLTAVTNAAMAGQDDLAPALATINRLLPGLPDLPPAVAKAAQALLAAQLSLDGDLSAENLRQALTSSGVFAGASALPKGDLKSLLLQLRSALMLWLGPDVPGAAPAKRAVPPTRGAVPRAHGPGALPAPMEEGLTLGELAKALLGETNAALHRLRLFQLAALPDTQPGSGSEKPGPVLVEVPMRLGQETALAQFQVGRDGRNPGGRSDGKRGWQMRFAINFSAIGEVGAQIALLGRQVNIALWAERQATADVLDAMLPEMLAALAAKGIEAVSLQCSQGVPKPDKPPRSGQFVDATR